MNNKEQRNFLLKEVQKRIVGPGYSEEVYACSEDASDEVLVYRPHEIYCAGILFPQITGDLANLDIDSQEDDQSVDNDNTDDSVNAFEDADAAVSVDETDETDVAEAEQDDDNQDKGGSSVEDTYQYNPSHIGLITCLDASTTTVNVKLRYGKYHYLDKSNLEKDVHVRLGRCSIKTLNETFDYYDQYAQNVLKSIGVKSVREMFAVDEEHCYVSPRNLYEIKEVLKDGTEKTRFVRPGDFPRLLQNKAATILRNLILEPNKSQSIKDIISWDNFCKQLSIFDSITELKPLLNSNNLTSFKDCVKYDSEKDSVKLERDLNIGDLSINEYLYIDDPVRDVLLERLLQFRFYKRQDINKEFEISLSDYSKDVNEDVKLVWKVIPSRFNDSHKYLRVLLVNKHVCNTKIDAPDYIHQAELTVLTPSIKTYTEPHRSAIADEEYELNELLYSDESVYAKGVNCAATWENRVQPTWVKTTYSPQKIVRSFSTESDKEDINAACRLHDMTIWSEVSKEEIIGRFRKMAEAYARWQTEQRDKVLPNQAVLGSVLAEQEDFRQRLVRNIDYLENNERAYSCFQLANTAMYIQMILSHDPKFLPKGKELSAYDLNSHFFDTEAWDYFSSDKKGIHPSYRPFQLAFLLMNIESTFERSSDDRNKIVDLIWFPTGGGKTEAYLALTALTIAERRTCGEENVSGVSVIMRYTLRLLTAQQFERASFLICSLEFLRKELLKKKLNYSLGNESISIGMWIGKATTPNKCDDLKKGKYKNFYETINKEKEIPKTNPFPVSCCPWCGCNLVSKIDESGNILKGYNQATGLLICIKNNCYFNSSLPIYYIDEQLYNNPPTLLFATVDKFAQLTTKNAGCLLGVGTKRRKPDLIIQDELHLISGPLGSIVGMFETMVEELCIERDDRGEVARRPKIIASTATTRNTKNLIRQLYDRNVKSFPVSGVRYDDNFFSHVVPLEDSKRLYAGLSPSGHTAVELEIRTISAELVAKEKLIRDTLIEKGIDLNDKQAVINSLFSKEKMIEQLDNYWTLVLYYKELKALGSTHSRMGQEILQTAMSMRSYLQSYPSMDFLLKDFSQRINEFTSRQDSSRIKQLLVEATDRTRINPADQRIRRIVSKMDIVQATNMISVGIDIGRWNVMIMNGQPLTTAEYIQASSRVGRTFDGLLINLLNPMRTRELSLFENFEAYHQTFYKYVEPLSVTTFTEMTLQKLMANLYICYMGLVRMKSKPVLIENDDIVAFKNLLTDRCTHIGTYNDFVSNMHKSIDSIHKFFMDPAYANIPFGNFGTDSEKKEELERKLGFSLMSSLRDVESNTFVLYE